MHPLGPLVRRSRSSHPVRTRLAAAIVSAACAAPLVTAARLVPDPSGAGTHLQLGGAPCTVVLITGRPCPTCGMTTAFAHAVRGCLISAFYAQPMGLLLAGGAALCALLSAEMIVSGRGWVVNWYRIPPVRLIATAVVLWLAAWVYKILTFSGASGGG